MDKGFPFGEQGSEAIHHVGRNGLTDVGLRHGGKEIRPFDSVFLAVEG